MREWLRNLRFESKMTQQDVADKLNISKQYYQLIESGKRQLKMSTELVIKFADIFCLSPVSILNMEQKFLQTLFDPTQTV